MNAYEAQFERTRAELLLSSAESLFKSAVESSSLSLSDPRGVKDELVYLKEFCSKLKFQYLEQETRDKFLRLLFLEDSQTVLPEELDRIVKENISLKSALKQLKSQMQSVLEKSEAMTEEVLALSASYESRSGDVAEALDEVDALQKELDSLVQDPENENYVALFNVKQLMNIEDIGLNEAIAAAEGVVAQESQALSDLQLAVERAREETNTKENLTKALKEKLHRFQALVDEENKKLREDIDPEQAHAQWLRELNVMVQKFVPIQVKVENKNDAYVLHIGSELLTLDRHLNVVECSTSSRMMAEINCADGATKFWKLLRFLSEMIFAESG